MGASQGSRKRAVRHLDCQDAPRRGYDVYDATHMTIGGTSQVFGGEDTVFVVDSLARISTHSPSRSRRR